MTKNRTFADKYCPSCFRCLLVNGVGHMWCPEEVACGYQALSSRNPPVEEIAALKGRRKVLLGKIESLNNRILGLTTAYDGYGERINKLLKEANDGK